jgi:uncharacterized protein
MPPPLRLADLPGEIYLLPIDGLIFLPETSFPLTFSDEQSRSLLDAAEAAGGYLGIVQFQREAGKSFPHPIFPVGCLVRLRALDRDEEGHHAVFDGLIRFRVGKELPMAAGGVRRAAVTYEEYAHDLDGAEEDLAGWDLEAFKEKLVEFGRSQFGTAGTLESMTPRQMIRFMAQTSPFSAAERQALLEAPSFREMLETLVELLALNFLTTTPDTSETDQAN